MTDHSLALDLGAALAPPHGCPSCGSLDLTPVCDEQGLLFECPGCRSTWLSELGALVRVDARGTTHPPLPRQEPTA